MGWPQASPREPLRCHISSLVIVETLKDSFEETQTGQTLLWSPVNHNSTLRDHISKSREIASHYCCILCHIRSDLTPQASRTRCSGSTVPAHCLLTPAASSRRGPWCTRERGRHVAPAGESARLRPARRCVVAAPWQDCGEELAEREQQMAKVCQRESLASGRRRSSP